MSFDNNSFLIEALKKGDEEAYTFLVNRYSSSLFSYALMLSKDRNKAQDILQNVFLSTWKFREKLDGSYAIKSFLYKAVYNDFLNTDNKSKKRKLLEQKYHESLIEVIDDFDESSIDVLIAKVTNEIDKLPNRCKEIFVLSKKEGLSNAEIAVYLNISIKTVENQKTKAFSILREQLEESQLKIVLWMLLKKSE